MDSCSVLYPLGSFIPLPPYLIALSENVADIRTPLDLQSSYKDGLSLRVLSTHGTIQICTSEAILRGKH